MDLNIFDSHDNSRSKTLTWEIAKIVAQINDRHPIHPETSFPIFWSILTVFFPLCFSSNRVPLFDFSHTIVLLKVSLGTLLGLGCGFFEASWEFNVWLDQEETEQFHVFILFLFFSFGLFCCTVSCSCAHYYCCHFSILFLFMLFLLLFLCFLLVFYFWM